MKVGASSHDSTAMFTLQMVQAAGVRLHAAVTPQRPCGGGAGEPVLLLHGFPDHWRLWEPLMAALAQRHHVLAPDLRGINLSDKPPLVPDYHVDRLVEDVQALILGLGGRCAVVGHDWGGMLAWAVAARHPALVSRLVVLNAPHPCRFAQQLRDDPAQLEASSYVRGLTASAAAGWLAQDAYARLWAVRSLADPAAQAARDERERQHCVQAWSQPGALEAALNWYRALDIDQALSPAGVPAVPSLGPADGHIEAPTLVIWGERDGSFPVACLQGLERWVPRLQLERVPEGGHWLLLEQPARVAGLVSAFLEDRP